MEKAVCSGSNMRAPMKMDFMRSLKSTPQERWQSICICRSKNESDTSAKPMCFESEEKSENALNCIGIINAPTDELISLLRAGAVCARVVSLCRPDGEACTPDDDNAWGYIVEYSPKSGVGEAVDRAIKSAFEAGRGSLEQLTEKAEYLLSQAVPEKVIVAVLDSIVDEVEYKDMIPNPPVKFVQETAMGELTRALSYRLTGLNLRLVGNKGSGKNTLMQTVDWLLGVPQYRMQGSAELDKLDLLGGPVIEHGTMSYKLSDMLLYLQAGADVVLDEGNTIKPECADVLHSLMDSARSIQVPGYGLVKMKSWSSFTITMNEDYAGTNFMNEETVDRFTPLHMTQPVSIAEVLHRVVPEASEESLRVCDEMYSMIREMICDREGLEPEAMTIRGFIDALRTEPLLGLKAGLMDNVAGKPQDLYTRMQLAELVESLVR